MRISEYFDRVYAGPGRFWWRDDGRYELEPDAYPSSLLTQQTLRLLAERSPGRALDIGAGEGTDAIRLALLGYEVDAVEVSKVGAEKIARFATEADAKLRVIPSDVQDFVPDELRGRIMAAYSFIVVGLSQVVGSFIAGAVAHAIGVAWAIGGGGAIMLAYALWAFRRHEWHTSPAPDRCEPRRLRFCELENGRDPKRQLKSPTIFVRGTHLYPRRQRCPNDPAAFLGSPQRTGGRRDYGRGRPRPRCGYRKRSL